MDNKWRVSYGIHHGTMMSRDSDDQYFDTEDEARDALRKILSSFNPRDRFGYYLWFASALNVYNGTVADMRAWLGLDNIPPEPVARSVTSIVDETGKEYVKT